VHEGSKIKDLIVDLQNEIKPAFKLAGKSD